KALLSDEVLVVGFAPVAACAAVDVSRQIKLTEPFIQWVPVGIAQRRSRAAAFARVRIEQHAHESQLLGHALDFIEQAVDWTSGLLGQAADAPKTGGMQLNRTRNGVVLVPGPAVDHLPRGIAVQHHEWTR